MSSEKQGNRIATSLAAAIMLVMPITIGYYLMLAGFGGLDLSPIFIILGGCFIAMGGSALLAWGAYKLFYQSAPSKDGQRG